ncbi:kynurenine formamidase [Microbacterium sp. AK009]|uniref:cyclase family protein n=1 Tax=Microbacterium sp. AK009 TaxID=2723068 RepID=UPI0015C9638A|nr:cyclase family protein [Microbacterium sp. AK009]NYF17639.1 kynurenine formamidase [Microbacterium sp. AK009]
MIHDLSHAVTDGMPVYPGDPEVHIEEGLTIAAHGVDVARMSMGSHTGTHVDAPSHTVPGGRTMASVGLDELVGDAIVLRVQVGEGETYGWRDLDPYGTLPAALPSIALISTGWDAFFTDDRRRLRHPALDPTAARTLVDRGVHVIAVDTLSPDRTGGAGFPVHDVVLGSDHLIVENVRGVASLPDRVRVGFFPLKISGDGAPVRAVAFT